MSLKNELALQQELLCEIKNYEDNMRHMKTGQMKQVRKPSTLVFPWRRGLGGHKGVGGSAVVSVAGGGLPL